MQLLPIDGKQPSESETVPVGAGGGAHPPQPGTPRGNIQRVVAFRCETRRMPDFVFCRHSIRLHSARTGPDLENVNSSGLIQVCPCQLVCVCVSAATPLELAAVRTEFYAPHLVATPRFPTVTRTAQRRCFQLSFEIVSVRMLGHYPLALC